MRTITLFAAALMCTILSTDSLGSLFTEERISKAPAPAASTAEGRIYFSRKVGNDRGWSILSIDPEGDDERTEVPFTSGMGEYNPALSPDGGTILFNTYRYGGWKLASRKLGKSSVTRLSFGDGYDTNGVYSPDGKQILFEKSDRSGVDILIMDVAAQKERNPIPDLTASDERVPVWTPDGQSVVFFSDKDGPNQIYQWSEGDDELRYLSASKGNDFAPAVSPDGTTIAFYSDRAGYADLFVMSLNGSGQVNLTEPLHDSDNKYTFGGRSYWVYKAAWSPDGSKIVFMSRVDGNYELYTVGADGSDLRRITQTTASELTPAWGVSVMP
jgi:Tol biopolymer transport system component